MKANALPSLNMTTTPEVVTVIPGLFLYLERTGPFMETAPQACKDFWKAVEGKFQREEITGVMGLSRIDHTKSGDEKFIYQTGMTLAKRPESVPAGLKLRELHAAKYARFLLTGSYMQLADAYPRAFQILEKQGMQLREDFCIEKYLNNPMETAEEKLETEILIPLS